jgi:hypothetical protein
VTSATQNQVQAQKPFEEKEMSQLRTVINRGKWTIEEDEKLERLVRFKGKGNWSEICTDMDGRTGKQCRERFLNHIQSGLLRRPWTEAEDVVIVAGHKKFGNKWAKIASHIHGKTENMVKNRMNTTLRRVRGDKNSRVKNDGALAIYAASLLGRKIGGKERLSKEEDKGRKKTVDSLDSSSLSGSIFPIANPHPSGFVEPWEVGDFPVSCQEDFGWVLEEPLWPIRKACNESNRLHEGEPVGARTSDVGSRTNLLDQDTNAFPNVLVLINEKEEVFTNTVGKVVEKAKASVGNDVSVIGSEIAVQTDSVLSNANCLEGAIVGIQCVLSSLYSQQACGILANVQVMDKDCSFLKFAIVATGLKVSGTQPFESFSSDLFHRIVKTICKSPYHITHV